MDALARLPRECREAAYDRAGASTVEAQRDTVAADVGSWEASEQQRFLVHVREYVLALVNAYADLATPLAEDIVQSSWTQSEVELRALIGMAKESVAAFVVFDFLSRTIARAQRGHPAQHRHRHRHRHQHQEHLERPLPLSLLLPLLPPPSLLLPPLPMPILLPKA